VRAFAGDSTMTSLRPADMRFLLPRLRGARLAGEAPRAADRFRRSSGNL
jgi:hypothetical protein